MENEIIEKSDLIEKISNIVKKKKETTIINFIYHNCNFIRNDFFKLLSR